MARPLGLKIALISVVGLAILALVTAGTITSVAGMRHAAMEEKVKALHAEVKGYDSSRPSRAPSQPGLSWDDYQKAFDIVDKDKAGMTLLLEFLDQRVHATREKAEAVVVANLPALDHLREGARREKGLYPTLWEKGSAADIAPQMKMQRVSLLATVRARFLTEQGKAREAAEILLDVLQLARDSGTTTGVLSAYCSATLAGEALSGLRDVLLSGKLSKDDLLAVEKELERFDLTFPRMGPCMIIEALCFGYSMLPADFQISVMNDDGSGGLWKEKARYGFSDRIMAADAFDEYLASMRRLERVDDLPWAEAKKLGEEQNRIGETARNPLSRIAIPGIASSESGFRGRRAQMRLLRVGFHYRATGEILDLADPFGDKLKREEKDGKLRLWSLGHDGVDQGGQGDWKYHAAGKDTVLEVPR